MSKVPGKRQWPALLSLTIHTLFMSAAGRPMNRHDTSTFSFHQDDPAIGLVTDRAHSPPRSETTIHFDQIPIVMPDEEVTSSHVQHGEPHQHLHLNGDFWTAALDPSTDYREVVEIFEPSSSEHTVTSRQEQSAASLLAEGSISSGGAFYCLPDPNAYKFLHGALKTIVLDNYAHYVNLVPRGKNVDRQTIRKQVANRSNAGLIHDLLSDEEPIRRRAALYMIHMRLPVGIGRVQRALGVSAWDVIRKVQHHTAWSLKGVVGRLSDTLEGQPDIAALLKDESTFHAALEMVREDNKRMDYGDEEPAKDSR